MSTKQAILVAAIAAAVHVLCAMVEAAPAHASYDFESRVVHALERIAAALEKP